MGLGFTKTFSNIKIHGYVTKNQYIVIFQKNGGKMIGKSNKGNTHHRNFKKGRKRKGKAIKATHTSTN